MKKIVNFMKRRKGSILLMAIVFGGLFFAFTNNNSTDTSLEQKKKLLAAIGNLLEKQHYSPKKIDDVFSAEIFKKYLEEIDAEKNIFLQSDIESLQKFQKTIDDEIHGSSIEFVPSVDKIYSKRIAEVITIYQEILSKPFDFSINENYVSDATKLNYALDETERKDRIRKSMKYFALERYVDLQELRSKSTIDSIKIQTDEFLEKDARQKVLKAMDKYYNKRKNTQKEEDRFNIFLNVITNFMDPHSDYFPPVEKRAFDEQMSNSFFGIGAQLQEQDGNIKIVSLVNGYPAARSGEIAPNDIILKVAQGKGTPVDITGYDVTDAVKLIRGEKDTEVRLTIKKQDGTTKIVALKRDQIVQDESNARSAVVMENNHKIGYIYLPDFYADFENPQGSRSSEDVAKEIVKLKAEKVEGIILDLRNNGGGSLYDVVQMVGFFIKQGPVVQVRDKEGKSSVLSDNNSAVLYDGPLAVMVNELSASASEIFAAAIQDYKRGIIIGSSSTYGKGTVQRNVPFGNPIDYSTGRTEFGAVKLTFQKFYRINGGSTQLKGVAPDVVLPDTYEYLKIREKDNPVALNWDEINKATYEFSDDKYGYDNIIKLANSKINSNSSLTLIKSNAKWLASNNEKPMSLNIGSYKAQQKLISTTVSQNNSLTKLKEEMNITVTASDYSKYFANPDKQKGERYQSWLKFLKSDLYINTTADIVCDMIGIANSSVNK
jgi:carboxyl-terminal processing protease